MIKGRVNILHILRHNRLSIIAVFSTSTWILKAVFRLQTEGEGQVLSNQVLYHPWGGGERAEGVEYSCSRPKTVIIKNASSRVSTILPEEKGVAVAIFNTFSNEQFVLFSKGSL